MTQIREIKKRIKAVANIRRITNTMQMIATARFKSALDRASATKPYTAKIRKLVAELAAGTGEVHHPLFDSPTPSPGRDYLLVLTSDRGLCGAYNSNVLRTALGHLRSSDSQTTLEVVGKKGAMFFRYAGFEVAHHHTHFGEKPAYADVEKLGQRLMDEYVAGRYDTVRIAYMKFLSAGRQQVAIEQILPLNAEMMASGDHEVGAAGPKVEYEYSPDAQSLLARILPISVKTSVFQAFNDAVVSEHVSRMVAMKSATDNATKLGKTLRRNFNRARQSQITTELTEIIGGAAALS